MKPLPCVFEVLWGGGKVQKQDLAKLVRHSLRCLRPGARIPNGGHDFRNSYTEKRSHADHWQRNVHYGSMNTACANAPKAPAKQVRRAKPATGFPTLSPYSTPPPPRGAPNAYACTFG